MQLFGLLALLPLIAAAPSPALKLYNPFPPLNSESNGPLISRDQLVSRAELEALGRRALNPRTKVSSCLKLIPIDLGRRLMQDMGRNASRGEKARGREEQSAR